MTPLFRPVAAALLIAVSPLPALAQAAPAAMEELVYKQEAFDSFQKYVGHMNEGLTETYGSSFFDKVESTGPGKAVVTAGDVWINSPNRRKNAVKFHSVWRRMNNNQPVVLTFVDHQGTEIITVDEAEMGPRIRELKPLAEPATTGAEKKPEAGKKK